MQKCASASIFHKAVWVILFFLLLSCAVHGFEYGFRLAGGKAFVTKGDFQAKYSARRDMTYYSFSDIPEDYIPADTILTKLFVAVSADGKKTDKFSYGFGAYMRVNLAKNVAQDEYGENRVNLVGELNWQRHDFRVSYGSDASVTSHFYHVDDEVFSDYGNDLAYISNLASAKFAGAYTQTSLDYIQIPLLLEFQKYDENSKAKQGIRTNTYLLAGPSLNLAIGKTTGLSQQFDDMRTALEILYILNPVYDEFTLDHSKNTTRLETVKNYIKDVSLFYVVAIGWQVSDLVRTGFLSDVFMLELRYSAGVTEFTTYPDKKNSKLSALTLSLGYQF